jgi:acyl-CoA thioester hydrolase
MSDAPAAPPLARSVVRMRVHYAEVDRMGFLHHSNHLRYFERGREEFCRRRSAAYREMEDAGVLVVVVDAALQFKTPLKYEDIVELEVSLDEVRHATIAFSYALRRAADGALAATGRTRHAFVSREGRVLRAPAKVVALLCAEESVRRRGELDE